MQFSTEQITPKQAEALLDKVPSYQRRLRPSAVRRYADDMRHGRWSISPAPIVVDTEGFVLDGQHRLAAVALAGITILMVVCRNAPASAFRGLDVGLVRSVVDLSGARYDKEAAAIMRTAMLPNGMSSNGISKAAVLEALEMNEAEVNAIKAATPRALSIDGKSVPFWMTPSRAALLRAVPYIGMSRAVAFSNEVNRVTTPSRVASSLRDVMLTRSMDAVNNTGAAHAYRRAAHLIWLWAEGRGDQTRYKIKDTDIYPVILGADGLPRFRANV
jgi:hypothetical protein